MKIAVVGAGGIGSHLIHMLVNTVDHEIVVFDGDSFEERNLERQLFGRDMIAQNKAIAMEVMYSEISSIVGEPEYIRTPEELAGFDFVFCVPDNNKARRIAIEACDASDGKQTLIVAGNEAVSANAAVHSKVLMDIDERAHVLSIHPEWGRDDAPSVSCSSNLHKNPQSIVANSIAASMCMGLFEVWKSDVAKDYVPDVIKDYIPIEYEWGRTFMKKWTLADRVFDKSK